MRRILPLAIVLAAAPAAADSIARPCTVTILRAPDDVRAEVGAWVEREPSCSVALEVRIVATDGGLYVLARSDNGRIFERIVPDAQSAGVLVASWMADDAMPGAHATPAALPEMPLGFFADPATMIDTTPHDAGRDGASHWLSLQGRFGSSTDVRAELDVITFGHWALGLSATLAHGQMLADVLGPTATESGAPQATTDFEGLIYLVRQIDLGSWHVRPAIALGAINTTVHVVDNNYPALLMTGDAHTASAMGELSFIVTRDLAVGWAIEGGIALDLIPQELELNPLDNEAFAEVTRPLEVNFVLGVGHRL